MPRPSHARLESPPSPDALTTPYTLAMKTPLPGALIDQTPTSTLISKRKLVWDAVDNDSNFDGFSCAIVPRHPKRQKIGPRKRRQRSASSQSLSQSQSQSQPPASGNPKKTSLDASNIVQPNPFPQAKLAQTIYSVSPAAPWECTTGYRIATIGKQDFKINQYIFVKNTEKPQIDDAAVNFWIARILEIRAGSKRHVYLRVYWMYRPEDLPDGRQPHHGECELIASNHMDIIEVANVHGPADVYHWKEDANDETIAWPAEEQLFWRQTFDVTKHPGKNGLGQFSKLPTYCIDSAPSHPDEPLVQCDSCLEWLHASCLEEQAANDTKSKTRPRGRPKKGSTTKPSVTAKLRESEHGKVRLTVTTQHHDQPPQDTDVNITCLMCHKPIASERLPEEPSATADAEPPPLTGDSSDTEDVIAVDLPLDPDATESEPDSDDTLDNEPASSATASDAGEKADADAQVDIEAQPSSQSKKRKRTSQVTPLAEIQNQSVLTSGVRSIKRILFR